MADTDEVKEQKDSKENTDDKKTSKGGILLWIIPAVVVAFCAGAGFGLGRLFAGYVKDKPAEVSQQPNQTKHTESDILDSTGKNSQKTWYYDLEPVVANLDEPGVTRYIRIALTLQINSEVDQKKGSAFLDEKKLLLTNWLTIYLAGLSIEDTRGDRNLKRIQSQMCDVFNEMLFPDAKPQIQSVLFREFAIQ